MNITTWKFKGCRPNGFPTIRLAQLASFIKKMNWNIDFWEFTANEIISFLTVELRQELPKYWQSHYHFSKLSTGTLASSMSRNAAELVIINSVVPFLGWYSDYVQNPKYQLLAIEILELLPKENNHTITSWKQFGKIPKSAAESQGLLELKNEFCTNKKCLDCKIGLYLLGK